MGVRVNVPVAGGAKLELPLAQVLTIARLAEANPGSTWHLNECGCCVCLHPGGAKDKGYVVNSDGDASFHEVPHTP